MPMLHRRFLAIAALSLIALGAIRAAEPEAPAPAPSPATNTAAARDRARVLHAAYISTLDAIHRYYFRANQAVLPARALEDVFDEMAETQGIEARWIAVNTPAMSIQHEPKTPFERQAASAIAAGRTEFEQVESGVYRRAGAIALADGCVACHMGSARPPNTQRYAGLVISMPVVEP